MHSKLPDTFRQYIAILTPNCFSTLNTIHYQTLHLVGFSDQTGGGNGLGTRLIFRQNTLHSLTQVIARDQQHYIHQLNGKPSFSLSAPQMELCISNGRVRENLMTKFYKESRTSSSSVPLHSRGPGLIMRLTHV